MDDDVLKASKLIDLQVVLLSLRDTHGDHPVLLETEADFLSDPPESRELYLRALEGATRGQIPTYTIRISLAELLLDVLADQDAARTQLAACADEVATLADQWDQARWKELLQRCGCD
jgi:hypothetical protein